MSRFHRVEELIPQLPQDHQAAGLKLSDPIVPALEYFLSLEEVPGFGNKLRDLKLNPVGPATTNARTVQWASLCAELGGITLLGKTLGLPILAFDQRSPRAQRVGSNCDVVLCLSSRETYVEIKRRASEVTQCLPALLERRLVELQSELPYDLSVQMRDRQYDCSDIESRLVDARQWVETFQRLQRQGVRDTEDVPQRMGGAFIITFHKRTDGPQDGLLGLHLDPDCAEELQPYLLGPGGIGRNGRPMVPKVEEAIEKGADYLLCRVSCCGWREIVEGCFGRVTWSGSLTCFAPPACLGMLRGVVLFSRYDQFCIVNNPSVEDGAWLFA